MSLIDTLHPVEDEGLFHFEGLLSTAKESAAYDNLAVSIIARNCETTIGRTIKVAEELSGYFAKAAVVVYTNDCTDDTAGAIASTEVDEDINFLHVDETLGLPYLTGTRHSTRTINIARCRNEALSYLPGDTDVVLVLDADLLEVTAERLLAGYGEMVQFCYDAMAGQNLVRASKLEPRRLISYDAFAFRPTWTDKSNYMIERSFHYDVRPAGVQAYRVRSAFGGACWYTGDAYFDGRQYNGEHGCEHVAFNQGLLMGICPSMSVLGFIDSGETR
jgi:hypothetical protein